jgi:HD-GYP domain-containing protein (c-di-GMP phosphodiesterase class II)
MTMAEDFESALQSARRGGEAVTLDRALDVLERFGQNLQQCELAAQQIPLVLAAVQESLGADVVFWVPGATGDTPEAVGLPRLTAEWCAAFVQRALDEAAPDSSQLVRHYLDAATRPAAPWPCSAALVRISKTRRNWMGALSFHSRRLFQPADLRVMALARRMVLSHRQQAQVYEKLREALFGLVRCLTAAIDAKDPYTWGHSERVARIAVRLARQMGLPGTTLSDLYLAGLLHDIGKIGIRDSVLQKTGKLSDEEFAHIQEHVVIGDRLISNVKSLQHLRPGVRNHHERWDGQGYPDRLAGEAIPLQARILAVADSCDAMMAVRPFRSGLEPGRIDAILSEGAGSQWDPRVVQHFLACRNELYPICQRGLGDSVFAAVERALKLGSDPDSSQRKNLSGRPLASEEARQADLQN